MTWVLYFQYVLVHFNKNLIQGSYSHEETEFQDFSGT